MNIRRIEAGRAVVAFMERYAAERGQAPPGDEQIGRVGAAVLVGGFNQLLVDWLAGRVPVGRDQLIDDATELFLSIGDAASAIATRRRPPARRGRSSTPRSQSQPAPRKKA